MNVFIACHLGVTSRSNKQQLSELNIGEGSEQGGL